MVILDRPRHEELIAEVREAGARIKLIADGDVSAAIATCFEESGVDVLMGTGGAPEGVIAAAALRCVRRRHAGPAAVPQRRGDRARQEDGHRRPRTLYKIDELAKGNVMFAATGVTNGDFLKGVRFFTGGAETHSVVMRSQTGTVRYIELDPPASIASPIWVGSRRDERFLRSARVSAKLFLSGEEHMAKAERSIEIRRAHRAGVEGHHRLRAYPEFLADAKRMVIRNRSASGVEVENEISVVDSVKYTPALVENAPKSVSGRWCRARS